MLLGNQDKDMGRVMALKPWYKVVTPREDLRDDKPLDASEFAVHLDQVRDKRAPEVYQNPARFFERTFLTKSLSGLAVEVLRRLSGEKTETSAVFNMTTQFGGGKPPLPWIGIRSDTLNEPIDDFTHAISERCDVGLNLRHFPVSQRVKREKDSLFMGQSGVRRETGKE
jgi:hypothetical protein